MIKFVIGNLKSLWPVFAIVAYIAIGPSCGRREVEEMSENSNLSRINLDKYRWKNRLILIFATSSKDNSYLKQKSEFEGKADELKDRDIVVIELLKGGKSMMVDMPLTNEQQSFLRKQFEVSDDFVLILIGKDGTVKLRTERSVLADDLFGLIDSMPMRKDEMRRKASQSQN
ncbi:MAG: DUF4174 domain-containing protein [Candidatus Hodarchaeota archaeon]